MSKGKSGFASLKRYFAAIIITTVIAWLIFYDYQNTLSIELTKLKEDLVSKEFNRKKIQIEQFFMLTYQTIRTIALLPAARSITGENIKPGEGDVVSEGRFTEEGNSTVQQLYNNLAVNFDVSEIYSIIEGFDHSEDEKPFLMYDEFILPGKTASVETEGEHVDGDYPDELEDEEYDYYPEQIEYFKRNYPVFNFSDINDIPAISSPVVRTCDNSQYTSMSDGDPVNADGILYSVPFYSRDDKFNGIISAIYRINVIEALMLEVPFIIVTDDDKKAAAELGFTLPGEYSDFVLVNKGFDVFISDRRDQELIKAVKSMVSGNNTDPGYFSSSLAISDKEEWKLYYKYNPIAVAGLFSVEKTLLFIRIAALFAAVLIYITIEIFQYKKRVQLLNRLQKEKFEGALELAGAACHELNQPLQVISGYSELLIKEIEESNPLYNKLKNVSNQINKLADITRKLQNITKYKTKDYVSGKIIDIDKSSS